MIRSNVLHTCSSGRLNHFKSVIQTSSKLQSMYYKPAYYICSAQVFFPSQFSITVMKTRHCVFWCRINKVLGYGQFGTVSKSVWQSPMGAMDVAVKQLQPGTSQKETIMFLQEAAINGQFRHPNVVQLMGVVTVGEPVSY